MLPDISSALKLMVSSLDLKIKVIAVALLLLPSITVVESMVIVGRILSL